MKKIRVHFNIHSAYIYDQRILSLQRSSQNMREWVAVHNVLRGTELAVAFCNTEVTYNAASAKGRLIGIMQFTNLSLQVVAVFSQTQHYSSNEIWCVAIILNLTLQRSIRQSIFNTQLSSTRSTRQSIFNTQLSSIFNAGRQHAVFHSKCVAVFHSSLTQHTAHSSQHKLGFTGISPAQSLHAAQRILQRTPVSNSFTIRSINLQLLSGNHISHITYHHISQRILQSSSQHHAVVSSSA